MIREVRNGVLIVEDPDRSTDDTACLDCYCRSRGLLAKETVRVTREFMAGAMFDWRDHIARMVQEAADALPLPECLDSDVNRT